MADGFLLVSSFLAGAMILVISVLGRAAKGRAESPAEGRRRRGTGHALLGLQGFLQPSVEHVVQAKNVEQRDAEDGDGLGVDEEILRSDLAEALRWSPVNVEEIRRHLATAARVGLDWRCVYEQAVAAELRARPYRAPSMPPTRRVRPME